MKVHPRQNHAIARRRHLQGVGGPGGGEEAQAAVATEMIEGKGTGYGAGAVPVLREASG